MKRKRLDDKKPLVGESLPPTKPRISVFSTIWEFLFGNSSVVEEEEQTPTNVSLAEEEETSPAASTSPRIEGSRFLLEEEEEQINNVASIPELPVELWARILSFNPPDKQTRLVSKTFQNARNLILTNSMWEALEHEKAHFITNKAAVLERTKNTLGEANEAVKKAYEGLALQQDYFLLDEALEQLNCAIIVSQMEKNEYGQSRLVCQNCFLTRLPDVLLRDEKRASYWKTLHWLDVDNNQLRSLPESIGQLANLSHLYVNKNQLSSLPESIGQLANLSHLYVNNNQVRSLPESIGQLAKLRHLYVNNNQLSSLPESIGQLANLWTLYVNNNQLRSLPESIGQLAKLVRLEVNNNQLSSKPEVLSGCTVMADNNPFEQDTLMKIKP